MGLDHRVVLSYNFGIVLLTHLLPSLFSPYNSPNPYRVAQTMKMHTPRIDYFLCSQSGVLFVAPQATSDPFADKGYPPLADKAWNGDSMDNVVPEDVQTCINQTTGVAEGLVRAYSPCAQVHLHQTQRPVKVVPPGQVGVWDMSVATTSTEVPSPVVVGLSAIGTSCGVE